MTRHSQRLVVEELESRLTPASFAFVWPDPTHLTLSFVPDGTSVGGQTVGIGTTGAPLSSPTMAGAIPSQLFSSFNALAPTSSAWQLAILQAFQTWAEVANINISLVSDNGQPLGTIGPPEGSNTGVGDIRVAAVPDGPGGTNLSETTPFDPEAGTWSGSVIFNSSEPFGVGGQGTYDLYTVALHEAGVALGLPDNLDPASVMFAYYNGPHTGLAPEDVSAIQSLYGPRPTDPYSGTIGTATNFGLASLQQYTSTLLHPNGTSLPPLALNGQITSLQDTDWFAYQNLPFTGFTVQLQTGGISLLDAKVSVYNSRGQLVQSATASNALNGNLSIRINASLNVQYYIEVQSGSQDAFGVGAYQLRVVPDSSLPLLPFTAVRLLSQFLPSPNNHSIGSATTLQPGSGTPNDFHTVGQLTTVGQTDFYALMAPQVSSGLSQTMAVMVWGQQAGGLNPIVTVYDAQGDVLSANVVSTGNGVYTVELPNAVPGTTYYIAVQAAQPSGPNNLGSYFLAAQFTTNTNLADQLFANGALGPTSGNVNAAAVTPSFAIPFAVVVQPPPPPPPPAPTTVMQDFWTLELTQNTLFHLNLSAQTPGATVPTEVEFTLLDANGNVLFDKVVQNGQTASVDLYLPAGNYLLRVVGGTQDGSPLPPTTWQVTGTALNDPIGPPLNNPSQPPPPPPVQCTWLDYAIFQFLALFDPYGHPLQ